MQNQIKQLKQLAPIQLISFDNHKNILINDKAADIISSFQTDKIAIVAVVGKYRTGKSFILNRVLLGTTKGFEVGPTINACTKGLWIWPELVEMDTDEGKVPVLIMDTEGLGSLEEGQNTDTKIFLLATLLSSYLIYNSMGSIDQKAIQNLGLIVNLSNILQKAKRSDQQDIVQCFPSFMWLVRDFFLKLQNENGQKISSKQYLENSLKSQKGRLQTVENKNKIRSRLREYFRQRECCTLVRPTNYDNDLKFLNTLPQNKLRPQFVSQIKQLKQKLFKAIRTKTFQGKPCSPKAFISMCRSFVQSINQGGVPSISSNWESVCNTQSQKIIQQIERYHEDRIQELLFNQTLLPELEKEHKQIISQGYKRIQNTFLGVIEKQQKKKKLKRKLKQKFILIRQQQTSKHFDSLKSLIEQAFIQVLRQIRVNKFESFQKVLQKFQQVSMNTNSPHEPEMMGELYSKLKNISVQYINCLQQKWKMENVLLKQKQQWLEKQYNDKKLQLQKEVEEGYQKGRKDEMQKYKLRCALEDKNDRLNNLEQQLFQHKQNIQKLQQEIQNLRIKQADDLSNLRFQHSRRVQQLTTELNLKNIQFLQLQETNKLRIEKLQFENNKIHALQKTIEQLRYQISSLQQNRQALEDSIKYSHRDEIPSQKQINLRLRILQKEKQCLLKQLQNQKSINQGLVKTFQSNPSFVLANQIQIIQKQNTQFKSQIKILKQYQKVLLSCDLLKCRLCDNSYSFGQFRNHLFLCNRSVEIDVSYQIGSDTQQFVFVIEIARGGHSWKVFKQLKHMKGFFRKLKRAQIEYLMIENESVQQWEKRRVIIAQVLQEMIEDNNKDLRLIQFLGLDIHEKKQERMNLSQVQESSFREVNNRQIWQQEPQQNSLGSNVVKKQNLLKTCKIAQIKGLL